MDDQHCVMSNLKINWLLQIRIYKEGQRILIYQYINISIYCVQTRSTLYCDLWDKSQGLIACNASLVQINEQILLSVCSKQ